MKIIDVDTIGQAWITSCNFILSEGENVKDEDEELRQIMHLIIRIKNPRKKDEFIEKNGDKKTIDWMLSNFLEQKVIPELNNSQSYGVRLFNYDGKNQIQWVIEKLKKKPESKSATITMLMPNKDKDYIPCVSLLDFKIHDNKLILTAFCRAIDFGAKAYANMIALTHVQTIVAKCVGIQAGEIILHIASAHIYKKDVEKVKSILKTEEIK